MPFKDLIVVVDSSSASAARIDLAVMLASEHDAHLAGLYILPLPEPERDPPRTLVDQLIQACIREERQQASETRTIFDAAIQREGVKGEWRTAGGLASVEASTEARYADLIIVGQRDPELGTSTMPPLLPEEVALVAGRPVLVVPRVRTTTTLGKRIVVGWNASREATRAVNDALPFLAGAETVTIAVVNPDHKIISPHGEEPGADIALHLARHGVRADVERVVADDRSAAATLIAIAAKTGSDLIVTGAYGHSRNRELIFGGVTRDLLRHATIPLFISH